MFCPDVALSLIVDPDLSDRPVWRTEGKSHLSARGDLLLRGVRLTGANVTQRAIRSVSAVPRKLIIDNCEIDGFVVAGVSGEGGTSLTCVITNTLFYNIGQVAVDFRRPDEVRYLEIQNCTFSYLGESAIKVDRVRIPVRIRISHITVHNAYDGVDILAVPDALISSSILTGCRSYALLSHPKAQRMAICTYDNRKNFNTGPSMDCCFSADPHYFDAESGDFSLLSSSKFLTAGPSGSAVGDLRWTGPATDRAESRRLWGALARYVFLPGFGLVGFLAVLYSMRRRELANRERVREQLSSTRSRLQHLLDTSPAVIYSCRPDDQMVFTFVSENVKGLLGGRVKRCVNRSGGQLLPGVDCGHSLVVLCINNV